MRSPTAAKQLALVLLENFRIPKRKASAEVFRSWQQAELNAPLDCALRGLVTLGEVPFTKKLFVIHGRLLSRNIVTGDVMKFCQKGKGADPNSCANNWGVIIGRPAI